MNMIGNPSEMGFFNNVISFIQMLVALNTPKVQAPFGVSLIYPLLIIQGCSVTFLCRLTKWFPFSNIFCDNKIKNININVVP
jgi:hypothetical protein